MKNPGPLRHCTDLCSLDCRVGSLKGLELKAFRAKRLLLGLVRSVNYLERSDVQQSWYRNTKGD